MKPLFPIAASTRAYNSCVNGRKIIARTIVFLLLGAIVNVAVAWWSAARQRDIAPDAMKSHLAGTSQDVLPGGDTARIAFQVKFRDCTWYMAAEGDPDDVVSDDLPVLQPFPAWVQAQIDREKPSDEHRGWLFEQRGWPARALWCQYGPSPSRYRSLGDLSDADRSPVVGGIKLKDQKWWLGRQMYHRALPYRPLWPGFAINTIFYAAILWFLFAAPFAVRRWRRIRRGLCPACAYDLRGSVGGS